MQGYLSLYGNVHLLLHSDQLQALKGRIFVSSGLLSKKRLFYRLSLICFLASGDIKQNICYGSSGSEFKSCVEVQVVIL